MNDEVYIEKTVSPAPSLLKRISWGAIFAGLAASIVIQLMFTLLGISIGASTINPLEESNPAKGLGIGSALWLVVSGAVSLFAGAWIAGRLSGGPREVDGMLHGVITWSVATITTVLLAASAAGALVGGAGSLLAKAGGLGKSAADQVEPEQKQQALATIEEQIKIMFPQVDALTPTGRGETNQGPGMLTDLARKDPQLAAALTKMQARGGANTAAAERGEVVNLLTTKHGMDQQQATHIVTEWDQRFQQAKAQGEQKAREVGDKVAKGASKGALWGFIALAIGGIVAAWGGWIGSKSLPGRVESGSLVT